MSDIAIRVENLSKKYRRGLPTGHDRLSETAVNLARSILHLPRRVMDQFRSAGSTANSVHRSGEFWALRNVSFEVKQGDVVGIVGRNGAGKSTLLKVLSRITEPTSGRFGLRGRVASLLEVGTGFHGELTGRENLYLSGTLLGMSRGEIQQKFDEIVAFAELDAFLDTPVKRYSSGMATRLAFAVAAHLEPEILIVDEVLAVGDAAFQKKCLGKMDAVAREGRTILFVSHNMEAVRSICKRAILLRQGSIVQNDATSAVIARYQDEAVAEGLIPLAERADRTGTGQLVFTGLRWQDSNGRRLEKPATGTNCVLVCRFRNASKADLRNVHLSIGIDNSLGQRIALLGTNLASQDIPVLPHEADCIQVAIERFPLMPGNYGLTLYCSVEGAISDWVKNAWCFEVESGDFFGTGCLPPQGQGVFVLMHRFNHAVDREFR